MLCCSWLLNLIFSTMNFALLPEKVIHLLTRSTQQQQHAAMIFLSFLLSTDTKRRDLLKQYGKNVKVSKVTCAA